MKANEKLADAIYEKLFSDVAYIAKRPGQQPEADMLTKIMRHTYTEKIMEVLDGYLPPHHAELPDRNHCLYPKPEEKLSPAVEALHLAIRYGVMDRAHHKAWVIDRMVRILAGNSYDAFVSAAKAGKDGPDTYEWDEGIAP